MAASIAGRDTAVTDFNTKLDALWLAAIELAAQELGLDKNPALGARFGQPICDEAHWQALKHPRYTGSTFLSTRFNDAVRVRALAL
jgi:hypothetical protein